MADSTFKCRICNIEDNHTVFIAHEMMYGTREPFRYRLCSQCGCLQIETIPDDMSSHYPNDYYSYRVTTQEKEKERNAKHAIRNKISAAIITQALFAHSSIVAASLARIGHWSTPLIKKWRPILAAAAMRHASDAVLDVGSGLISGALVDLEQLGCRNLTGIDPYIDRDHINNQIMILRRGIFSLQDKYRLVMFNHSLEHMADGLAQLKQAHRLLADGGACLVRIPTVDSFVWQHYGTHWVELDAPRHLFLHSMRSISLLANAAEFHVVQVQHEATAFEFIGSEQYQQDIPLRSVHSHFVTPKQSIFSDEAIAGYNESARWVNNNNAAGRISILLAKN
jgi:hypothetical protein